MNGMMGREGQRACEGGRDEVWTLRGVVVSGKGKGFGRSERDGRVGVAGDSW